MIELREFKPEHIDMLTEEAIDSEIRSYSDKLRKYYAEVGYKCGVAYSGFYEDKLIGSGGILITHGNVGTVWAVFSTEARKHKKTVLRSLRVMLEDYILPETNFRKLRTLSRLGFPASQSLLKHMGFQCKGLRNNYYLYTRLI